MYEKANNRYQFTPAESLGAGHAGTATSETFACIVPVNNDIQKAADDRAQDKGGDDEKQFHIRKVYHQKTTPERSGFLQTFI